MKKIICAVLLFGAFTNLIFSQEIKIKSLKFYAENDETSFPLIIADSERTSALTIQFDVESSYSPQMSIVFKFCDRNWVPTSNIFLQNYGENIAYNLKFNNLPTTVADAQYFFRGKFPNSKDYVKFPFSGRWRFFITDANDTSVIYSSGKFFVVHQDIPLSSSLRKERLEDKVYFPADLANVFNITTEFDLNEKFFPDYVDRVEIIENRKIDYPIIIDRKFNTNRRQYYWDSHNKFRFTARDIRPGNEYREVDLRDINIFNSTNVRAQFDGMEYSRFFIKAKRDLNGGSILTDYNNEFATYLNVSFNVNPPPELSGDVYLVGAFNNWNILPEYKMNESFGIYSITVPLKRGIYDYQYVMSDGYKDSESVFDWYVLEGNNWETTNEYYIFVFYEDPNFGGYDRIIAVNKIVSK